MLRLPILCLLLAYASALMAADDLHGRLWLKDAANGDARVGPSMPEGIPQGHVLKVAIGGTRLGRKDEAPATLTVVLHDAARELASASITLDANGYGETLIPIGAAITPGVYQIRLGKAGADAGKQTGLGATFRVLEAAPPLNLPFGAPGMIILLGAIAIGLFALWRRPRRA